MAQNNKDQTAQDVGAIREILMGTYIREYAAAFQGIEARMTSNDETLNQRLQKMESDFNQRLLNLELSMKTRLDALEAQLKDQVERLESAIQVTDKSQKQKLSQLFTLLSNQITNE
jgi:enoyl-[acyl-carrier-protein] reductase (NADH)